MGVLAEDGGNRILYIKIFKEVSIMGYPKYENILLEKDEKDSRITNLTLNRPQALNALSDGLRNDIDAALTEVDADEEAVVLIFKAAGRAFSTGYDLSGAAGAPREYVAPTVGRSRHISGNTEKGLQCHHKGVLPVEKVIEGQQSGSGDSVVA